MRRSHKSLAKVRLLLPLPSKRKANVMDKVPEYIHPSDRKANRQPWIHYSEDTTCQCGVKSCPCPCLFGGLDEEGNVVPNLCIKDVCTFTFLK